MNVVREPPAKNADRLNGRTDIMPIQRSGPTPPFHEYIARRALIPHSAAPSPQLLPLLGSTTWVEIPRYQRGISWKVDNVREFLDSTSILLGNVILAQFPTYVGQFANLPEQQKRYDILVDGLQRFAVGTMLLSILYPDVLAPTPNRPGDAPHFVALQANTAPFAAVIEHNNREFLAHPRHAIREQYKELRAALAAYIAAQLDQGKAAPLALAISNTFLARQVAIDTYFNFETPLELMSTFLGINTVRVDLGPVDLLRALVIERAVSAQWASNDIDDVENAFTDVFTSEQRPNQRLLPFVNSILKVIGQPALAVKIFPTWSAGLTKQDVDDFLEFASRFDELTGNGYLDEIRECGNLPGSMVLAHYYGRYLANGRQVPSFFVNAGTTEDHELHAFLLAAYRLVLDGSIARTTPYLDEIVSGAAVGTLRDVAERLSVDFLAKSLTVDTDGQWLSTMLGQADKDRAKRAFNAMLLPARGTWGAPFAPLTFGRKSTNYHIDHLIPESMLAEHLAGYEEGVATLKNFAPLPSNQNRAAKATSCSVKLGPGGIYRNYIAAGQPHPYAQWLVSVHFASVQPHQLDDQALLEPNRNPPIGTARIDRLRDELLARL